MPKSSPPPQGKLKLLGKTAPFPPAPLRSVLETFGNRSPGRDYLIRFECLDFTSLCPVTGHPDFASVRIEYVPDQLCIETKSLKFYLAAYRNTAAFNEEIANAIFDDLVAVAQPRRMTVFADFSARGGISLSVEVSSGEVKPSSSFR